MPKRSRTHSRVVLIEEPRRPVRPSRRAPQLPPPPPLPVLVADEEVGPDVNLYEFSRHTEREERRRLLDRAEQKTRTPGRQSLRARLHELQYRGEFYAWRRDRAAEKPAWLTSLAVVLMGVGLLAVMTMPVSEDTREFFDGSPLAEVTAPTFLQQAVFNNETSAEFEIEAADAPLAAPTEVAISWQDSGLPPVERRQAETQSAEAQPAGEPAIGLLALAAPEMERRVGSIPEGRLAHRDPRYRPQILEAAGGTPESERAVTSGLAWLAARQLPDGSWPAEETAMQDGLRGERKIAATALALLPFLGSGSSAQRGWHREPVERGVRFLANRLPANASTVQPAATATQLEARALTALALVEAYTLSPEPALGQSAQIALDVLVASQDPISGGWRTAGGTAASPQLVGWHMAALTAGREAGLRTSERTLAGVSHYFADQGAADRAVENVVSVEPNPAGAAAGLLAQSQLLGQEAPAVNELLAWLAARGPDKKDAEYNFHATQAMYRLKSPAWPAWNNVLRDQLVGEQIAAGADRGSWLSTPGGSRQRETALTLLTLEVYYRTAPLTSEAELAE